MSVKFNIPEDTDVSNKFKYVSKLFEDLYGFVIRVEPLRVIQPADFQNGWTNFGLGNAGASYYKDILGRVHVQGLIALGVLNTPAFTLPVGYRPASILTYPSAAAGAFGYMQILADGRLFPVNGSNVWFSINVSFRAA